MVRILLTIALAVTPVTWLVTYHFGIRAVAYLAFIPIFLLAMHRSQPVTLHKIDFAVFAMISLVFAWMSIGGLMAMSLPQPVPFTQQVKTVVWYMATFLSYVAVRFLPMTLKDMRFTFAAFVLLLLLSVPVVYLQQMGLMGQFYFSEELDFAKAYRFRDVFDIIRSRNTGFFGNPHESGAAQLALCLALFAIAREVRTRALLMVFYFVLLMSLGAIFLTGSRSSFILFPLTILTYLVVFEIGWGTIVRKVKARPSAVLRVAGLMMFAAAIILVVMKSELRALFEKSMFMASGLSFIAMEDRVSTQVDSLSYLLLTDPIRSLFGWGMGTGGLGAITGIQLLPVNTVDLYIVGLVSNMGLLGAGAFMLLFAYLTLSANKIYRNISLLEAGVAAPGMRIISLFTVLALIGGFLSTFMAGQMNLKNYTVITFLCLGMVANHYARLLLRVRSVRAAGEPAVAGRADKR